MTDNIDANKIVDIIDKLYVIPEGTYERLRGAGFTDRQAKATIMFANGDDIMEITKAITKGSSFTQNAYDAVGSGVAKLLSAMLLMKELQENTPLLTELLRRGLNYSKKFKMEFKE